jgi:two-component system osmolarity sensor histidine kinase EnvZ
MNKRPLGMVGRIAIILIFALGLELAGNLALAKWQERELLSADDSGRIAARLVEAERVALAADPKRRGLLMQALAEAKPQDGLSLNWVPRTVISDVSLSVPTLDAFRTDLLRSLPADGKRDLRLTIVPTPGSAERDLLGAWQLADGSYISFRISPYMAAAARPATVILLHLLLVAAVLGIALLSVRALVRPLGDLAKAADATGHGRTGRFDISGPPEVRSVATAFAAMQKRLLDAAEEQTEALVAVSHDLRTPIQRMRLRTSLVDDPETREAVEVDLAEMEDFIDSTLAYFRTGDVEEPRLVDVAALVSTVADNAADAGHDVRYDGPDDLVATVHTLSLKRAVSNLVDNAIRHAGRVDVRLAPAAPDHFVIAVDDDGPGISAADRAKALMPFRRLDGARSKSGDGAGLGLPATLKSVEKAGGSLTLGDSKLGGLRVEIRLPCR